MIDFPQLHEEGSLSGPIAARRVVAFAIVATLLAAGCSPAVNTREAAEVANIWPGNVMPKTQPAAFVQAFQGYCGSSATSRSGRLARDDYVEIRAQGGFRAFVTDSRKPLVAFRTRTGSDHCYVAAEARTGQHAAIGRMIAADYPTARRVDPSSSGLPAQDAWLISREPPVMVYTMRAGAIHDRPKLILGRIAL